MLGIGAATRLQEVVTGTDELPFLTGAFESAKAQPAYPAGFFDLAKDRLDRLLALFVKGMTLW